MTLQINQCILVDAESVSVLLSLFLFLPSLHLCLSLSLPCYRSVYFVYGVGALYLFYRRQIPGVCIFSQQDNCRLKSSKLLVFVFVIFMIKFLAATAGVWLHCC